jgi:hypothetical protein
LELILIDFIDDLRTDDCDVTVKLITLEAMKADPEFYEGDGQFSKIRQWVYNFLKRHEYAIRQKTHVAQKRCDLAMCLDFVVSVNAKTTMYNIHPDFVVNMDQTPLYNDQRPSTTVCNKGQKSVNGKQTRTGDYRCTVFLAVTLSGKKLPPLIVFKGQPGKTIQKSFTRQNGYPDDVICLCQAKAWCDTQVMHVWIEKVYKPWVSNNVNGFNHLLIDDYSAHKVGSVMASIKSLNSFLSVLPGGSTSQIQVLDVGVNKPFKDKFRGRWVQWMAFENRDNQLVISRQMLTVWVKNVWEDIQAENITRTWTKIGFYQ